jgi:hypothetical protein
MYISTPQILISLERLASLHPFFGYAFFAFKSLHLPVGETQEFNYAEIRETVLDPYYKIVPEYDGYFNPFRSNKKWVSSRYESTSLQRIVADTFSDAFIHEKGSSQWGWRLNYTAVLRARMIALQSSRIPLLDIAVWLYRKDPDVPPGSDAAPYLMEKVIREFHLTPRELADLFVHQGSRTVALSAEPADLNEILNVIGWPEGVRDGGGVILEYVTLTDVGPSEELGYFPRERLNLITGDNSLGKTFLLDCVWWAVTGNWARYPAEPRRVDQVTYSELAYALKGSSGRTWESAAPYNRLEEAWQRPADRHDGLAVYATHSGSIAVWDPTSPPTPTKTAMEWEGHLVFERDHVWEGLTQVDSRGRKVRVINGLVSDWAMWQLAGDRHEDILLSFERCLHDLSPPDGPILRSGGLGGIQGDAREFPTIRMPYGNVPIVYASAGIQRILGLAYILVWQWKQHVQRSVLAGRAPVRKLILLVDELEAHLHPRWQRQILPALLRTLHGMDEQLTFQVHISTHSPLVLASAEPVFNGEVDGIHHLTLVDDQVELLETEFFKHGTVDSWLESEVFGLTSARSIEAEQAIERAKRVQLDPAASGDKVNGIHRTLVKLLPDDDPFWVRWNYFVERSRRGTERQV